MKSIAIFDGALSPGEHTSSADFFWVRVRRAPRYLTGIFCEACVEGVNLHEAEVAKMISSVTIVPTFFGLGLYGCMCALARPAKP